MCHRIQRCWHVARVGQDGKSEEVHASGTGAWNLKSEIWTLTAPVGINPLNYAQLSGLRKVGAMSACQSELSNKIAKIIEM